MQTGGIATFILDLGTIWRWVVSFTPNPFYSWGNSLQFPLNRMLDVVAKTRKSLSLATNLTPVVKPTA
jgi:hypothetical protein